MGKPVQDGKTLAREGLKEVLKVNFDLYKDEPDFFEYLTTLVIYLMSYEFDWGNARSDDYDVSETSDEATPTPRLQRFHAVSTRCRVQHGHCPHCNNPVPATHNICPFCLAMVEH